MPMAPGSRCRHCRRKCRGSVCSTCEAAKRAQLRREKPVSGRGGYDTAWRKLAKAAIAAQPWCSWCGATEDLQGDHIDPTKREGLTLDDVAVLCGPCNRRKGGRR